MGLQSLQSTKVFGAITSMVLFLLMWVIFGWSYDIHDYTNYLDYYIESPSRIKLGFVDIGYNYLNYLFYSAGWTFVNFRIFYSLLCVSLLFNLVYKYSEKPIICLIIYFICIFFVDLVQMRNFFAYLICFNGLQLLNNNVNYGKLKFAILICISITIHIACVFYFVFLIAPIKRKLNWKHILLISALATIILPKIIQLVITILGLNIHDTLFYYSIYALIPGTVIILFNIVIISSFTHSRYISYRQTSKLIGFSSYSDNVVYNCNILLLFLMPFLYMSAVSIRLERNFVLINIIYIVNKIVLNRYRVTNSQMILFFVYLIFNYLYFVYSRGIVEGILNNNFILK